MQLTRILITSALDIGIQQNGKQTENRVENQKCNQHQSKLKPYRLTIMTMPKHSATQHGHVFFFMVAVLNDIQKIWTFNFWTQRIYANKTRITVK